MSPIVASLVSLFPTRHQCADTCGLSHSAVLYLPHASVRPTDYVSPIVAFLVSLFPTKLQCADTCELGYDPARSTAIYPRWTGHSPTAMFSSTVPIRQWLRRNLCDMVTILLYLSLHRIAHSCRDRRIVTSWRGLPKTLVKFYAPIHLSYTRLRTVN